MALLIYTERKRIRKSFGKRDERPRTCPYLLHDAEGRRTPPSCRATCRRRSASTEGLQAAFTLRVPDRVAQRVRAR